MKLPALLITTLLAGSAFAQDTNNEFEATEAKIKTAMSADIRVESDKERDGNRNPVGTLKFLGLRDDMKVIELLPGGGWYTHILAPVLSDNGELHLAYGTSRAAKLIEENEALAKVHLAAKDANIYRKEGARFYSLENADLGVKKADMVLTFRNYHNFAEDGRKAMNDAAWDALKVGGIYGVIDHTRRHMEGDNNENGRRIDPVLAIKEIQAAGFELVDFSDIHYRADDELEYEVGRRSVSGNTDRFTLKFKKVNK